MGDQFASLGVMYEEMFRLPWRAHLESFSVFNALGDVRGAAVLDIGCGTGLYSRELKRRGAGRVVGYDVSDGMLAVARQQEDRAPLDITYVTEPPPATGSFDKALAVYVLPYAQDYPALVAMCAVAARALRPGGLFVTLPINPDYHGGRHYYERYGLRLFEAEPRADASRTTLELCFGQYQERITARYWSRSTLEQALREAGFTAIGWPAYGVSEQGLARHEAAFWRPYLDCPHASIVTATRR